MVRGKNYPVTCNICNVVFRVKKCDSGRAKYCSQRCCGISKKGIPTWNKGKVHTAILRERNPNWILDRSKVKRQNERNNPRYKLWRADILKKDGYTCQMCGQIGGKLHADHIKEYAKYPELRYELYNGRTLCIPCHNSRHNRKTHKIPKTAC